LNQFQHQPAREERNVVRMWLDGGQHLPRVRSPRLGALDLNFRGGERAFVGHRARCRNSECAPGNSRNKFAALHRITSSIIASHFGPCRESIQELSARAETGISRLTLPQ